MRALIFALLTLFPFTALACGTDPIPAPAAAEGLTCEVFQGDMTSAAKYDVNDTMQPGYNWYVHQRWPNAAQDPPSWYHTAPYPTAKTDYTINASGLTMQPAANNYMLAMFNTCAPSSNAAGWVGQAFTPPFYVNIAYSYTGSCSTCGPSGDQWADAWMLPTYFLTSGVVTTTMVELDIFESIYQRHIIQWSCSAGTCNNNNNYYVANLGGSVNGTLVLPATPTGEIVRYTNDSAFDTLSNISPTTVPVSSVSGTTSFAAGTFSTMLTSSYCLMLSTGPTQPYTVTSVEVWQRQPPRAVLAGGKVTLEGGKLVMR